MQAMLAIALPSPNYWAGRQEVTGLLLLGMNTMQAAEIQAIRYSLAAVWLVTGIISLGIYPVQDSLALLAKVGIHGSFAVFALYAEAVLDIVIGILTLTAPGINLWLAQALIIGGYSVVIAICLTEFLIHPFGPILKKTFPFLPCSGCFITIRE